MGDSRKLFTSNNPRAFIITGSSDTLLTEITSHLNSAFYLKDLGLLSYFLGIQVIRSSNSLFLSQQKYIRDLLDKYGFVNCNSVPTPISPRTESAPLDAMPLPNASEYRQLVGALQYLYITRPDITTYYAIFLFPYLMRQLCIVTILMLLIWPIIRLCILELSRISIDYHFVREKVALGDLQVVHVPTHARLADVFIKPNSGPKFRQAIANLCRVQPAKD
ncbi:hypothetical protein LIER_38023 [Lithospermum erythrorhizon]|uniref:Reverse transcriptase Ty1/copia-type domain-containing protein n=1 Tax=Lithospermum erythrorhizon TaxID=34254 RepID=A0AAV3PW08_LITER